MSQLIQMRQRIKAVQTIKKITHAMRLISMSVHSRLRTKKETLLTYQDKLMSLLDTIRASGKVVHPFVESDLPTANPKVKSLIIIIGSHKGLCGNFNTQLFDHLIKEIEIDSLRKQYDCIPIGRMAIEFAKEHNLKVLQQFRELSVATLQNLSLDISKSIFDFAKTYKTVTVYSNKSKSFFVQTPKTTTIIPYKEETKTENSNQQIYATWPHEPQEIFNHVLGQSLATHMYYILFESLLSEQAARFVSMDSSTRNAKQILEDMQLEYNKRRQADITKELTDLAGALSAEKK
ncbi:F0F1 ATP synthase subunit gamma [bacterium]|jgi:F-type H+-transporting ATPase subunit gamma|nr:F0F1 ATP synthase subunit gamma [bacterium]MBT3903704.1 F0F1 ATP synthase subunit gamma [bacterium]MBT4577459.1 F0F1 ATP synthase subunit gamma [bacterium]MBT5345833.1 F0F1 ATP synthase subunit gamma [bacterium]MBT6131279.1 F0F1 ATP synthase subunit gamma [bacterium]